MTRLEALVTTNQKFTDQVTNNIIPNVYIIDIIIYYEYLLDTNPAEVKYTESNETESI